MRISYYFFAHFQNFTKILTQIFEILIIHKPSLGSRKLPQKYGPNHFSRFDVFWNQTNKQTSKVYIYDIDNRVRLKLKLIE